MVDNIIKNKWIFLQEVSGYLCVNRHTIMRWIEQRNMSGSKVGKLWCFKTSYVDEWVKSGGTADERGVPQ